MTQEFTQHPTATALLLEARVKLFGDSTGELLGSPVLWRNSPRTDSPAAGEGECAPKSFTQAAFMLFLRVHCTHPSRY
jgi:hypothetical protein